MWMFYLYFFFQFLKEILIVLSTSPIVWKWLDWRDRDECHWWTRVENTEGGMRLPKISGGSKMFLNISRGYNFFGFNFIFTKKYFENFPGRVRFNPLPPGLVFGWVWVGLVLCFVCALNSDKGRKTIFDNDFAHLDPLAEFRSLDPVS